MSEPNKSQAEKQADQVFELIKAFVEARISRSQAELLDVLTGLEKRLAAIEAIARGERR